jgi:carbon storage regulator
MLVLRRKVSEKIIVAGNIVIEIVSVCGGRVAVGVTAPKDVSVHREEVQAAIKRQSEKRKGMK